MGHELVECTITHSRVRPKKHRFETSFFWFGIDLLDTKKLHTDLPLVNYNSFSIYSLFYNDHLNKGKKGILENVMSYLQENKIEQKIKSIKLYTNLRFLGYTFNPISIYHITLENDSPLSIIQIGNTFGEHKPYLVESDCFNSVGSEFTYSTTKHFYISPFISHDHKMIFKVKNTVEKLEIFINDFDENGTTLTASMTGKKHPLTAERLILSTLKFPFSTLKTIFLIHFHAFILWSKKLKFYKKDEDQHLQIGALSWKK